MRCRAQLNRRKAKAAKLWKEARRFDAAMGWKTVQINPKGGCWIEMPEADAKDLLMTQMILDGVRSFTNS